MRHRSTIGVAPILLALVATTSPLHAQRIFHSTQAANLPTTETVRAGNLLFEISHRFLPPVSEGADQLWGLDGPIWNRLGLSYGLADDVMIGVQRSNLEDNLELNAKIVVLEGGRAPLAVNLGAMGGVAWNTDPVSATAEDNEVQLYVQLLFDVLLAEELAVGLVPTYLRNPLIIDAEAESAFALGLHAQWYFGDGISLLGEWIFTEAREEPGRGALNDDAGTLGIEIETRGHFFKILLTNQPRMNPTQFLAGAPVPFEPDELRLGFNITRLLPF
jgi:hypothetical protein